MGGSWRAAVLLTTTALASCAGSSVPLDADATPVDASRATTRSLDLLLMIDDSSSMAPKQAALAAVLPSLFAALASGDRDGDGVVDFTPVRSLHVGIVDSDMGLGDAIHLTGCEAPGDDGILQVQTRTPAAGCVASYASAVPDRVFAFEGPAQIAELASEVACMTVIGTDGCGIEFELEAPLAALTRHASDTNAAFLRPDAALAILTLDDEDDCSTDELAIYSLDDPRYDMIDFDLRCHFYASHLYPVARYIDGFAGLRDPGRIVFASITGIPIETSGMSPTAILADPAMGVRIDPTTHRILPACTSSDGRGAAYAGVRMTQVAEGLVALGAHVTVQSICAPSFEPARDAIVDQIALALN